MDTVFIWKEEYVIKNKKDINKRLNYLLGQKSMMERLQLRGVFSSKDAQQLKDYFDFLDLTPAERFSWQEDWDAYYLEVRETPVYQIAQALRNAYHEDNRSEIKRLLAENKAMMTNKALVLDMPKHPEPAIIEQGYAVGIYLEVCSKIETLMRLSDIAEIDTREADNWRG